MRRLFLVFVPVLVVVLSVPAFAQGSEVSGLVKVPSDFGMDETYDRLVGAIEKNEKLTIVAEVDHTKNAEGVGMDLNPTRLVIFGNPNLGTGLMQSAQTTAIDLPQKFLVYEDAEGQVFVSYNDPTYLSERHGIQDQDEELGMISKALAGLAATATGTEPEAEPLPDTGGTSPWLLTTATLLLALGVIGALSVRGFVARRA